MPWKKKWQPTLVFVPGKSHGQRSLGGYSPWGWKTWTRLNHHHHPGKGAQLCVTLSGGSSSQRGPQLGKSSFISEGVWIAHHSTSTSYVLSFSFIICIIQMIDVQHLFSKSLSISLVISISLCVLFCGSWCWWALTFQAMNTVLISYHHFFYSSLKLVRIFKALGNLFYMLSYNFVLKYSFQFCFLAIHSSAAAVLFNWA